MCTPNVGDGSAMRRIKRFFSEWAAHRAGRKPINNSDIRKATRHIVGPTGYMLTKSVDKVGEHGDAYLKSFDDRIPPSLFVSERDRTRLNQPIPLVERAISDVMADPADKPKLADYEVEFQKIDAEAVSRLISQGDSDDPGFEAQDDPGDQ
jgi:hypothetical protein